MKTIEFRIPASLNLNLTDILDRVRPIISGINPSESKHWNVPTLFTPVDRDGAWILGGGAGRFKLAYQPEIPSHMEAAFDAIGVILEGVVFAEPQPDLKPLARAYESTKSASVRANKAHVEARRQFLDALRHSGSPLSVDGRTYTAAPYGLDIADDDGGRLYNV